MYSQYKGGGQGSERWLKRREDRGRGPVALGARARSGKVPRPQMQGGPAGVNMNVDPAKRSVGPSKPIIQPPVNIPSASASGMGGMGMLPPEAIKPSVNDTFGGMGPYGQGLPFGGKGGKGGAPQGYMPPEGFVRPGDRFSGAGIPSYADHLRGQGGYSF